MAGQLGLDAKVALGTAATLYNMERYFGVVCTSEELIQIWQRGRP